MTDERFSIDDACYGLRNLLVGDEEETRIGDLSEEFVGTEVFTLAQDGKFEEAYELAITSAFEGLSRAQIGANMERWAREWNADCDEGITYHDLMDEFDNVLQNSIDRVKKKLAAMEEDLVNARDLEQAKKALATLNSELPQDTDVTCGFCHDIVEKINEDGLCSRCEAVVDVEDTIN